MMFLIESFLYFLQRSKQTNFFQFSEADAAPDDSTGSTDESSIILLKHQIAPGNFGF